MDVEKYLARMRVEKPIGIDLDSLTMLQKAHLKTIPFENLDIHYGREISLEIGNVFEKIVLSQRGGFC
ncbi:MAG: arylamine N-acetyltransferase, partial [Desulfuromonas sp.]